MEGLRALLDFSATHTIGSWRYDRGKCLGHDVSLVQSGVGKVLSSAVTQALISAEQPDAVIFTGIAGGIDPSLRVGDVIVATDCIQHDMDATALGFQHGEIPYTNVREVACDDRLRALALTWQSPDHVQVLPGRILSGDQFIAGNRIHHPHLEDLAGAVVEMEGAAVATVARWNSVPCCVIRTVSDKADGESKLRFEEFLPIATMHSVEIIKHLLGLLS